MHESLSKREFDMLLDAVNYIQDPDIEKLKREAIRTVIACGQGQVPHEDCVKRMEQFEERADEMVKHVSEERTVLKSKLIQWRDELVDTHMDNQIKSVLADIPKEEEQHNE